MAAMTMTNGPFVLVFSVIMATPADAGMAARVDQIIAGTTEIGVVL